MTGDRDTGNDAAARPGARRGALKAALAILFLNAALGFNNWWPTLAIKPDARLAPEFVVLWVILLVAVGVRGAVARRWFGGLAAVYTVLIIGRYADVTAPALFGRPLHLYWDGAQLPRFLWVTAQNRPPWEALVIIGAVLLGLWGLFRIVRAAIAALARHAAPYALRSRVAGAVTVIAVLLVAANTAGVEATWPFVSKPVSPTLARELHMIGTSLSPARLAAALPSSPPFASDLAGLAGSDVKLFFLESYGAIAFDNPAWRAALAASRGGFARRIEMSGLRVVSAFVRSPTFGGASDLAHLSLLSGIDLSEPLRHDLLLTTDRPTLLSHFRSRGYETYGFYPGLSWEWPERAFYGYDRFVEARDLGYAGPEFGYWKIPDQFAIARFDQLYPVLPGSPPRFLFFATINTHVPFRPLPPYQPDWSKLLSPEPYEKSEVARALADKINWTDLAAPYVGAMKYTYRWLEGYLARPHDRDFLLVLIGDHQPLGAVTGEGQPWDVPVHVIAANDRVLDRLVAAGFRPGMEPARPTLGGMHELTRTLLEAFDGG